MELLVVIAIVGIVAGVLFPAIFAAKRSAYRTSELSALRQIGVARELYLEQNGAFDGRATTLVRTGLVPAELLSGRLDPTEIGFGNEHLLSDPKGNVPPSPYRDSCVAAVDAVGAAVMGAWEQDPASGWLMMSSPTVPSGARTEDPEYDAMHEAWTGDFHRLRRDGGAVHLKARKTTSGEVASEDWFWDRAHG